MELRAHGGNCCGRRHILGMDGATTDSIRSLLLRHDLNPESGTNKIVEIVVSEENEDLDDLKAEIVRAGFVLVASWDNDSGSVCWMYLYAPTWTAFPNGAAINVEVPEERVVYRDRPAPAIAARVVISTFHNDLLIGRGAGFDSYAAARAAAPRARSVSRRDVFSDGRIIWVSNVQE